MKYVIVGGGSIGRSIADSLKEDYIIVEKDEKTYEELIKQGYKALLGDARDENFMSKLQLKGAKVILATNDDEANLQIAEIARKLGVEEIVARVEDGSRIEEYAKAKIKAIACDKIVAAEIMYELSEGRKRYFEIVVSKRNFAGKRLSEINVGEGCTVVVVFRGGLAYKPNPDFKLEEGDRLGIICGEEIKATKKPFEEVLVVVTDSKQKDKVFREARMFAERFDAELIYLYKSQGSIMCSLATDEIEDMSLNEAIELLKAFEGKVDLMITNVPKSRKELVFLEKFPVLLAKGKEDYKNALVIVNTSKPEKLLNYASAISNFFGETTVLFLNQEQLKAASSIMESPKMKTSLASHNPLVEVISEVKKEYDLVILSAKNDVGNLSENVLWKVITKTNSSVMVIE